MVAVTRPVKAELCWRLRDALELSLKTNIPADDAARVTAVNVGKYTGDREGIYVSVHADHPLGFQEFGRYDHTAEGTMRDRAERPYRFPTESIGGSHWDLVYGGVEIRLLKEGTRPEDAVEIIETLKARIRNTINGGFGTLWPLKDTFGYMLFNLMVYSMYGYPGGGDDVSVDAYWVDYTARTSHRKNF